MDIKEQERPVKKFAKTEDPDLSDFGADFEPLPVPESYYPSRKEYMAGKALQGLVAGRSEKDLKNAVRLSLALAEEMEAALDSAQN